MLDNIFLSSTVYLSYTFGQAIFNRIISYLESLFNLIGTLLQIDKTNIKITLTLQMKKLWTRGIKRVDKSRQEVTFLASPEGLFRRLRELQIFMGWHPQDTLTIVLKAYRNVNVSDYSLIWFYEPMQTLSCSVWPNVPTKRILDIFEHGLYFSMLMNLLTLLPVLHYISSCLP